MTSPLRKTRNDLWLMVLLGAGAIAMLVVFLFSFARQTDSSTVAREEAVVHNGLAATVDEIAHLVVPQVVWDEAVIHLDNRFDAAWATDNIGQFLFTVDNFNFAYVLDGDASPIYGMRAGADVAPESFEPLREDAVGLVAAVRAREAQRRASGRAATVGEQIQASAIRDTADGVYILTATLVQPDFGKATVLHERAPVVLTGRAVDDAFVELLGRRYMLDGVRLRAPAERAAAGEGRVPLKDDAGATVARLTWKPQTPGANFLGAIMPWVLAFIVTLATVAVLLYRRARRAVVGLQESEARATHMAHHDALTGIANRACLEQRMVEAMAASRSGERIAILQLDLDGFKELNDTHGHLAGDELLRAVARRLKGQCREGDLCVRLGGDEFAVLQFPGDEASAKVLADRLLEVVRQPFQLSCGTHRISCSIGAAISNGPDSDRLELLRQSDLALYDAKANGKARLSFFRLEMDSAVRERAALRDELSLALASGDLHMVYQPQVDHANRIVGMEALLRWSHPERGAIPPALFVPIAEQSGLMAELGEYTIRRTFADCRRWPGMRVAINISASMIRTPDFASWLLALAHEYAVDPALIEVELTEGVVLNDNPQVQGTLYELRAAGFSLALDDFGTGYSSLSYLQRFPIDKIKIDRSFVTNLGVDAEADAVVVAIVQLAKALNLSVIAEGVETDDQRKRLLAVGCMQVQGYLTYRPMSADLIDGILRAREAA